MEVTANGTNVEEMLEARDRTTRRRVAFVGPMTLRCAVELGIPGVIRSHGTPITVSDLIPKLTPTVPPSKAPFLRRIMRALAHMGYFEAHNNYGAKEEPAYSLSPLCEDDSPSLPLSPSSLPEHHPSTRLTFQGMSRWFRSESTCNVHEFVHGKSFYETAQEDPEFSAAFNRVMASGSQALTRALVVKCKEAFAGLDRIVDVGGGTGTCAFIIAEAFPGLKVTVLDLPHVVADVVSINPHVDFIGGSMFDYIPRADAIFLKWTLHNWMDEECVKILKKCREAIISEKGGKVMIVEMVLNLKESGSEDSARTETQILMDISMMVQSNGKEREEHEWEKIFIDAGFSRYTITPMGLNSLIEVFL